mmetsp:Transcript_18782/g.40705  ORF Transcript_18782/g.40705 Transcript_18782/m.40705 type:complete len:582 (-) Transcript_18782:870-2615(-)
MDNFAVKALAAGAVGYVAYSYIGAEEQEPSDKAQAKDGKNCPARGRFSIVQSVENSCRTGGNRVATVSSTGETATYTEFRSRVARAGTSMKKILKIRRDTPVALLSLNSVYYLEAMYSIPWCGGLIVPLNIRLAAPEIADVLNDCKASIIMVDDAFLPAVGPLKKLVPSLVHVIYVGAKSQVPEGLIGYDRDLVDACSVLEPAVDIGGDDTYGIFYTGGTTGKSKGVLLSHTNLFSNAYGMINALQYSVDSRYLHAAPMFHAADGANTFALTMVGGSHVFIPKFTPQDTLVSISKNKVTHVLLVPTMISMVLAVENIDSYDLSSLKRLIYGASPIAETTLNHAMSVFSGCEFFQGYGMTECSPVNTILTHQDHIRGGGLLKSVGRAVPHAELKIIDSQGNEVPCGVVGELAARGPHVMKGYLNQPDLTDAVLKDGWMHTGDGAVMDEEGYIYIKDRIKDMIVTGGENVYSVEVESAIYKLPEVGMCAVIGIPDEKLVEKVCAIIVPKDFENHNLTEESVRKHCHTLIAGYKCPKKSSYPYGRNASFRCRKDSENRTSKTLLGGKCLFEHLCQRRKRCRNKL